MENTVNTKTTRAQTGVGNLSWIWQAVTGAGLVILASLHMVANHFVVEGGLQNFEDAQKYLSNPVIMPLELLFLICVTSHALLGVRAILFDFGLSEKAENLVNQALIIIGVLTVGYGAWLTWAVVTYP